jgi:hypothetical protein
MKAVLGLNASSSSIKFALFKPRAQNALERVCRGAVEEIGAAPRFVVRDADDRELECQSWSELGSDFHFLARQVRACARMRRHSVAGDYGEVLEDAVGGGRARGIGLARPIEAIEIERLAAEPQGKADTSAREAQQRHLLGGYRRAADDRETDTFGIEAR